MTQPLTSTERCIDHGTTTDTGDDSPVDVLVVDTDQRYVAFVGQLLENHSEILSVTGESDSATALERLDRTDFDCVVSGHVPHRLDGVELTRQLAERWPEVPVVMFTYDTSSNFVERALAAGAADVVQKGTEDRSLVLLGHRIRRVTEARRVRAAADRQRRLLDVLDGTPETNGQV